MARHRGLAIRQLFENVMELNNWRNSKKQPIDKMSAQEMETMKMEDTNGAWEQELEWTTVDTCQMAIHREVKGVGKFIQKSISSFNVLNKSFVVAVRTTTIVAMAKIPKSK